MHRLRVVQAEREDFDVIIVGGGVAGLTSAIGLLGTGLRMILLEREDVFGGRAQSRVDPATGDPVHVGPHVLLDHDTNFLALLDRLGTADRIVWPSEERAFTLLEGERAIPMRRSRLPAPMHFLGSLRDDPSLTMRDLASSVRVTELALGLDAARVLELDRRDARSVLEELGVRERMLRRYWAFLAMSALNVPLERCSAGALLRVYQHIVSHPAARVGLPGCGLGDLFAPAATRALEHEGHPVWTSAAVESLFGRASDGGARVAGLRLADGRVLRGRYVVASLPPQALLRSLPEAWRSAHPALDALSWFEPVPYVSVYLWFDRKVTERTFWSRTYAERDLNSDFYDYSNLYPSRHDAPSLIGSNIVFAHRAAALDDEEIVLATHRELCENLPGARAARIRHAVVHRIPLAVQAPYPGFEAHRPEARSPVAGLVLAGDYTRTGLPSSMESAAASGWRAAETILAAEGRPRELVRPLPPPGRLASVLARAAHFLPSPSRLRRVLRH